jgi:hypothetical protein
VERRKYERTRLQESVVVLDESGESLLGEASDISIGGMFIQGVTAPLASCVVVYLRFTGDDWAIALPGIVRWVRGQGVGVHFGQLGARETHAITEAIARAAPSHTRQRSAPPLEDVDEAAG